MKLRLGIMLLVLFTNVVADDKHYQLAHEHVLLAKDIYTPIDLAEGAADALVISKPQLLPYKEIFVSFYLKLLTSDEYIDAITRLYMENFSVDELEYINNIYKDPRMKSYLKKQPLVFKESKVIGEQLAKKYEFEFKGAIQARAKKID
jgi:hypothetical protein